MTVFIPIVIAQSLFMHEDKKSSSICATVIKIGDLKSGTSSKSDWTKKDITLKDDSGEQVLTAWNNDIKKFELNITYKIENPYWTIYDGKPQLSLGQYATVTIAVKPSDTVTTFPTQRNTTSPDSDEYLRKRQAEMHEKLKELPPLDEDEAIYIRTRTVHLYQINNLIRETLEEFDPLPNGAMVGQFTRIIKDELKEKNLESNE